jgi:hypothetical protein
MQKRFITEGPVFQPECRLVAVTLPQGGINDKKKRLGKQHKLTFSITKRLTNNHIPC